jgi:hypothetical protein
MTIRRTGRSSATDSHPSRLNSCKHVHLCLCRDAAHSWREEAVAKSATRTSCRRCCSCPAQHRCLPRCLRRGATERRSRGLRRSQGLSRLALWLLIWRDSIDCALTAALCASLCVRSLLLLLLCVRLCVCAHCCSVCSYAQAALKKKTEQAGRWKKLYDEAQEEANRKKEEWAAAEVKAYRLVPLPVCVCYSSMLPLAAHTRAC